MADGFLGRWSRRKQEVREGRPPEDATVEPIAAAAAPAYVPPARHATAPQKHPNSGHDRAPDTSAPSEAQPPRIAPTLDDVQTLTPQSDFSPFVARDVTPEVKNAAMKKLFADPHFNVMDGMDVYIDDYSRPDPLPAAMLRQLASAKFLQLFDEKPEAASQPPKAPLTSDKPSTPDTRGTPPETSSPTASETDTPLHRESATLTADLTDPHHDHTDLRLQQDHAARPPGPGEGPG